MNTQFTMVPVTDLTQLIEKVETLAQKLERATVKPGPEWVSVPEAAKLRGVKADTVRRWIVSGRIEARGVGRARVVRI